MDRPDAPEKEKPLSPEWEKLNTDAAAWYNAAREGNEEWRKAEEVRLLNEIVKLVPPSMLDGLSDFWRQEWPKFNANRGTLSKFVYFRLKKRAGVVQRIDRGEKRVKTIDPETGKEKKAWLPAPVSLNAETQFGELGDRVADPEAARVWERELSGMLLLATAVQLNQSLSGLPGKGALYFPLFLTDDVADRAQHNAMPGVNRRDELRLFSALCLPFLDFFMLRTCRTLRDLAHTPLKLYGTFVECKGEKEEEEETPLPLPNAVYTAYLSQEVHHPVTEQAVSNQHGAYRKFVRKLGIF